MVKGIICCTTSRNIHRNSYLGSWISVIASIIYTILCVSYRSGSFMYSICIAFPAECVHISSYLTNHIISIIILCIYEWESGSGRKSWIVVALIICHNNSSCYRCTTS